MIALAVLLRRALERTGLCLCLVPWGNVLGVAEDAALVPPGALHMLAALVAVREGGVAQ